MSIMQVALALIFLKSNFYNDVFFKMSIETSILKSLCLDSCGDSSVHPWEVRHREPERLGELRWMVAAQLGAIDQRVVGGSRFLNP